VKSCKQMLEKEFYSNQCRLIRENLKCQFTHYWLMHPSFYYELIGESGLWNVFQIKDDSTYGYALGYEIKITDTVNEFKLVMEFK